MGHGGVVDKVSNSEFDRIMVSRVQFAVTRSAVAMVAQFAGARTPDLLPNLSPIAKFCTLGRARHARIRPQVPPWACGSGMRDTHAKADAR